MLNLIRGTAVALVFFAGSFGFLLFARGNAPSFQQCQSAQYETNGSAQKQPEGFSFLVEKFIAPLCTAKFLEAHNAVITAIATVLLTFVTGGLVWAGYQQIRTIRAQLRAYVYPESIGLYEGMMLEPPRNDKINEPGIVIIWKNTGQTPAANVISWANIAVIPLTDEDKLIVPPLKNVFANHLGAGGTGNKSIWYGRALTDEEIGALKAGEKGIYVFGRIEYFDIFDRWRWTAFRVAYVGQFPPPKQGVTFSVCVKGNDAR